MFLLPLKSESPPPEDLLTQARAKIEAKEHATAEKLAREVLLHQPVHAEAAFLLGVVLARQEKWEAARKALERAIDLSSRFAPAHLELAGVRYRQGANHEAMRLLRETISMDPENSYARHFLATLSYLDGRRLEALYHWNAVGEPRFNEINYLTPCQANPELIGRLFRACCFSVSNLSEIFLDISTCQFLRFLHFFRKPFLKCLANAFNGRRRIGERVVCSGRINSRGGSVGGSTQTRPSPRQGIFSQVGAFVPSSIARSGGDRKRDHN